MALSAAERAEMAALEKELGTTKAPKKQALSPAEQAEMQALEAEVSEKPKGLMDQEIPLVGGTPRGYARGALDTLPVLGALGGGVAGGALGGGIGAIPGAAAGGVAGESLKHTLQGLLGEGPKTRREQWEQLGDAALTGAAGEAGGQILAGPIAKSFANSGVKDIAKMGNRPGTQEITKAATNLGVKPTDGMLTDDYIVRNLENSLSQSPTVPGGMVRRSYEPIYSKVDEVSSRALDDASALSPNQAGRDIRQGVVNYFEGRAEPLKKAYDEIATHTKNVPINEKGLQRISKNIRGLNEAKFAGSEEHQIANQFADWLETAKSVDDIKVLSSKAKEILRDPNASGAAKKVAGSIVGKLEQAQGNSITRQAVSVAREGAVTTTDKGRFLNKAQKGMADQEAVAEGESIGKKLVGDIKQTNKGYRTLMDDVRTFGEGSGLTKGKRGLTGALEDIASKTPEELPGAVFDTGNVDYMRFVQKNMPKEFETARQLRLQEIAKRAESANGKIDPKKLQKIVGKMKQEAPEALEMLFGKENLAQLEDAGTLVKSLPQKVGASDTPRGLQFNDIMSVGQNIKDVGRYGLLKGKKNMPKAGLLLEKARRPAQGLLNKGLLDDN